MKLLFSCEVEGGGGGVYRVFKFQNDKFFSDLKRVFTAQSLRDETMEGVDSIVVLLVPFTEPINKRALKVRHHENVCWVKNVYLRHVCDPFK